MRIRMKPRMVVVAALAACSMVSLPVTAEAKSEGVCPNGQLPVIRVLSEGHLNMGLRSLLPPNVLPNVGFTKFEYLLGPGRYEKSIMSGTRAELIGAGALSYREVPTRRVTISTGTDTYHYDELDHKLGRHTHTENLSASGDRVFSEVFLQGVAPMAKQSPKIGKARYAGIECEVHSMPPLLANNRSGNSCVAILQGRPVVLAQDWIDGGTGIPQTMHAVQVEMNKCVTEAEFRPSPGVKFKSAPATSRLKFHSGDEDEDEDQGKGKGK